MDYCYYVCKFIAFASKPEVNKRAKSKATKNKNPIPEEEYEQDTDRIIASLYIFGPLNPLKN